MKNRTGTSLMCKGVLIPSRFWLLKVGVSVMRKTLCKILWQLGGRWFGDAFKVRGTRECQFFCVRADNGLPSGRPCFYQVGL
uniref:hypothetical protein n=1 Tax=Pseudomonas lactucae TaxID=2813360 RepID=UPI002FCCC675